MAAAPPRPRCDRISAMWAYRLGVSDKHVGMGKSIFIRESEHWNWWLRGYYGQPFVWEPKR